MCLLALDVVRWVVRVRPRCLFNELLPCRAKSLHKRRKAGGVVRAEDGQLICGVPRDWLASALASASVWLQACNSCVAQAYLNGFEIGLELFFRSTIDRRRCGETDVLGEPGEYRNLLVV